MDRAPPGRATLGGLGCALSGGRLATMDRPQVTAQVHRQRKTPIALGTRELPRGCRIGPARPSGSPRLSVGRVEPQHATDRLGAVSGDALPGDSLKTLLLALLSGELR
ncbi:MAG: hypothetical protein DME17_12145 [Candidatus Rokuibacteriota bacterium]|nr:MAG: hypothetical protein DME17_12145 [Candidatus Rokubacteria bacterium]